MRAIMEGLIVGLIASLLGSYAYTWLTNNKVSLGTLLAVTISAATVVAAYMFARSALRVPLQSDVIAYYPHGQDQYLTQLIRDLGKSKSITLVGARGQDIVGERSPIGSYLVEKRWHGKIVAYLLDPESRFARLRPNSLEADVAKYHAECRAVQSFLDTLALRHSISVKKIIYDSDPKLRAILLDRVGYVAFYEQGVQGSKLPTYRIRTDTTPLSFAIREYASHLEHTSQLPSSHRKG